jgi:voltage-gated potassium channel
VVITLSTVGFEEVHDLSDEAKLHTSVLILLGVGGFAYLLGSFTEAFVEGRVQMFWGKKKMQKKIEDLSGHYIICGYSRIGSVVAKELTREHNATVIIESNPSCGPGST